MEQSLIFDKCIPTLEVSGLLILFFFPNNTASLYEYDLSSFWSVIVSHPHHDGSLSWMSNPLQSWSLTVLTLINVRRLCGPDKCHTTHMKTVLRLLLSHCWETVHHFWPAEPLAIPAKPVLQSVSFCWVSSESVQRSENLLENYSDQGGLLWKPETPPMLWMRTLQHHCNSKPRHIGYLPLRRDLSHLFLSESTNSLLKQWAKHSNIKK